MLAQVHLKGVTISPTIGTADSGLGYFFQTMEGEQPHPLSETWIIRLLSTTLLIRAKPRFPPQPVLQLESLHKPLSHIHQSTDRMKITITEK